MKRENLMNVMQSQERERGYQAEPVSSDPDDGLPSEETRRDIADAVYDAIASTKKGVVGACLCFAYVAGMVAFRYAGMRHELVGGHLGIERGENGAAIIVDAKT